MKLAANLLTALVAVLHLLFLVLEMFLWTGPTGQSVFGTTPDFAAASATLAMNQGLYNGFLAAGLAWGIARNKPDFKVFFLICVIIAGIFGGLTAKPSIIFVQALPALIALVVVFLAERQTTKSA